MKKVILTVSKLGAIFTLAVDAQGQPKLDKNGKRHGFIRVENPSVVDLGFAYNNGGVKRGASALIAMTEEAWNKSKDAYKPGMEIKGNVVVLESTERKPGFQPKLAGTNGVQLTFSGQPIYRGTQFDATCTKEDELVAHDNTEAIKEAQIVTKAGAATTLAH